MDATQRSKTCFFGTEPLQDSYFVVEDMGVTFGVRLGGVDRVALYGHMLRSRNCSYIFPFLWQPKIWHVMKLYGKGVADGHGECGELCAAFIRLVQSWLGCRETRGYKKKIKKQPSNSKQIQIHHCLYVQVDISQHSLRNRDISQKASSCNDKCAFWAINKAFAT